MRRFGSFGTDSREFRVLARMISGTSASDGWRASETPAGNSNPEVCMSIVPQPCARCGELIPAERIEALPDTMVCVTCSKEIGGEFQVVVTPERISKEGSLKKNYGGYSTRKIRKPIKRKGEE
jgi:hypothetical protein